MINNPYRLITYALHLAHANVDEMMIEDMADDDVDEVALEEDYLLLAQLSAEDWMYILEAAVVGLQYDQVLDKLDLAYEPAEDLVVRLGRILS